MRPTVRIAPAAFCLAPLCLAILCLAACSGSPPTQATETAPSVHDAAARIQWAPATPDTSAQPPISDELRAALNAVNTEPGDLPRLKMRHEGRLFDLPLQHTGVEIEASGPVAAVEVRQRYRNPFREPIETVYVFPLPENSAVTDLRFEIGDRVIESELQKRAEARRTYEKAKAAGHTAALLEQERPNGFTQSVANIPPQSEIEVVIRYVQDLTYDANTYELVFPMVIGPRFTPGEWNGGAPGPGGAVNTDQVPDAARLSPPVVGRGLRTGHDIDVKVTVDAGRPVLDWTVPTHRTTGGVADGRLAVALAPDDRVPNRDFVLRYRVGGDATEATLLTHRPKEENEGYFALMVHPPTLDLDRLVGQREMIFVLDVSGSMSGLPIAMSKRAIELALHRLRPGDTFNVLSFAGRTSTLYERPRPANRAAVAEALKWVDRLMAGGGTMIGSAIDVALAPDVEAGRDRHVFFLTDGYVSNEGAIMKKTRDLVEAKLAAGQRGRVFGFGVGSSVNRCLLNGLSAQGRGITFYATSREDPAAAVDRFFALVDQPVLTDVQIDWGGLPVADVTPAALPDLFASRPLMVHGRFTGLGAATATLRGKMGGQWVEVPLEVDLARADARNGALAALWARAQIDALGTGLWDTRSPDQGLIDRIVALSLAHRVMTPYTSFVAVDRSRVVDGTARRIDQPVEAPEGVDPEAAGARTVSEVDAGPVDTDQDGILDQQDACPTEPEVFNGVDDQDGCPDRGAQKVVVTSSRIQILEKVYFAFDKPTIKAVSYQLLDEVAMVLQQNPWIKKVRVEGHTDSVGNARYNNRLSQRRAEAVRRYLIHRGVDEARLEAVGYGEERPIAHNKTAEGRARNRRVEFHIVEGQPASAQRYHGHMVRPPSPPVAPHLTTCTGTWISPAENVRGARVEPVETEGLDPLWLSATLADARACYDLALLTKPDLKGELSLHYTPKGAERTGGAEHAQLVRCIAESHAMRGTAVDAKLTLRLVR